MLEQPQQSRHHPELATSPYFTPEHARFTPRFRVTSWSHSSGPPRNASSFLTECPNMLPSSLLSPFHLLAHHMAPLVDPSSEPCGPPRCIVLKPYGRHAASVTCNTLWCTHDTCKRYICHVPRPLLSPFHLLAPLAPLMDSAFEV